MRVRLNLEGLDGNAFSLLGAFRRAARGQGYSQAEIDAVTDEARTGDYNHLITTLALNTVSEDKDDDDGEFDDEDEEDKGDEWDTDEQERGEGPDRYPSIGRVR